MCSCYAPRAALARHPHAPREAVRLACLSPYMQVIVPSPPHTARLVAATRAPDPKSRLPPPRPAPPRDLAARASPRRPARGVVAEPRTPARSVAAPRPVQHQVVRPSMPFGRLLHSCAHRLAFRSQPLPPRARRRHTCALDSPRLARVSSRATARGDPGKPTPARSPPIGVASRTISSSSATQRISKVRVRLALTRARWSAPVRLPSAPPGSTASSDGFLCDEDNADSPTPR